jgi:hypothetical protein
MAEYIKRSAVFEQFDNADADVCETDDFGGVDYGFGMKNIKELINAIPAADVVEVVRCKDCKYNRGSKKCLNPDSFFAVPKDDDFCSYGERKEGGAE